MAIHSAVQLIVFGQRNRTDFAGVLRDVKGAGFEAIEAGNLFEAHGEEAARRLLREYGVGVAGAHFGYGEFVDPERLERNIAYCKSMGIANMMCSGVSDPKSVVGYRESSAVFNRVGRRLRDEGLRFHYHNHAWEFEDLGGTHGMSILDAETDPDVVKFNIDVFWVTIGGRDPAQFIEQHAARAGYYHFKDGRRQADGSPEFLELGVGEVDLVGAMAAARKVGAEWVVAEQDRTILSHQESIGISRAYLRDTLGV